MHYRLYIIILEHCVLTEFSHDTPENNFSQDVFETKSNFTPSRNRDRDILTNLNLDGMETYYQNKLSQIRKSEFLKLISNWTIVIKTADKGGKH